MERDERVMVLGEDVGKKGGVFGATEGLWAKYGDKRVLDTPLTEGMIAGAAMGAAVYGLRPIAEMQFADFVYPGLQPDRVRDQPHPLPLERHVQRADGDPHAVRRRRPRRAVPPPVERGLLHLDGRASRSSRPALRPTPRACSRPSIRDPDPVMFFEHKKTYRLFKAEVPDGDTVRADRQGVGRPRRARTCRSSATATCAPARSRRPRRSPARTASRPRSSTCARSARSTLETILASVAKTGKALVVHEANRFGGFGAEIAAEISEKGFEHLDGPVTRLAGPDVPGVPYHHNLEDWFMIGPARIVDAARKLAAY